MAVCTFSPVVLRNWHGRILLHSVRNCDNWLLKQCSFICATGIEVFLIAGDSDCLQESTCKYKTCEKVINNTAWL